MPTHYVYRDATTGEFVTEEYALANPETTVREEVEDDPEGPPEDHGFPYHEPYPLDSPLNLYRAWLDYQISNDELNTNDIWVHANDEDEFAQETAMNTATGEVVAEGHEPRIN